MKQVFVSVSNDTDSSLEKKISYKILSWQEKKKKEEEERGKRSTEEPNRICSQNLATYVQIMPHN
jgi:hypothetical protein